MSGDVQPRKRKDKKRKKDELGVEEHRGTAATLGEGDVFMHSHHDHGTGGHWCAKIIFFSLLAVLIGLIGLIILENRGLTELEANSVETRYSGVLNGWLEDAPDDDHHDEHTLELLKHHDIGNDHKQTHDISQEDQDEIYNEENDSGHDDEDDSDQPFPASDQEDSNEDENQDEEGEDQEDSTEDAEQDEEGEEQDNSYEEQNENDDDEESDDDKEQTDSKENEQDEDNSEELQYEESDEADNRVPSYEKVVSDEDKDDDDIQDVDEDNSGEDELADNQNAETGDENSRESENNDEEHEEHEEDDADSGIEVEKLETEASDEDAVSAEQPTEQAAHDEHSQELSLEEVDGTNNDEDDDSVEDAEFLEDIDEPLPVVEHITVPKGKPLAEMEDEETTYKPTDTLADEEEYEKQQEELRRDEAQASHVWLKLVVGGALLVATHAVVSRVIAPRDATSASDEDISREATPSMTDRRMTLILEEVPTTVSPEEDIEDIVRPKVEKKTSFGIKSVTPIAKEESEDEEEDIIVESKNVNKATPVVDLETEDKELFSDEDADEVDEEEEILNQKEEPPKQPVSFIEKRIEPEQIDPDVDDDVPDDVEIIDDERLEEELEEEEDEDDISDVDDAELLTRLEAKYGRLPEPDRGYRHKDGGNSVEDEWPGEPSDKYWREQLDEAEQELRQGSWSAAISRVSAAELRGSGRARWLLARAMDAQAEAQRDNRLLSRAIAAYLDLLKLNDHLSDVRLREVTSRTLDRIKFRGQYQSAEPVYRLLIRRFPDVIEYRNNLTISFLMANRADLAEEVTRETLIKWPNDRLALAHIGFILKTRHNRLEEAVEALQKALEGDVGPATEPRYYYHLGDALLLLNRFADAQEVHQRGAKLGHFLSPNQRSLYNVERLKSRPWWNIEQTPYLNLARALEKSWKEILKEGQAAQALYEQETEGLKERGEWSQLDLFARGQEVPGRCKKAPVTCSIVRSEKAAVGCRRGQVKFSAMEAGTHVRPHVGPTNCRLRMHLGLSNTKDTYIRVDQEIRQWQAGKVFMFDDSFEHEVWHNGTGKRLVLIVDVWHPELSADELRQLAAI